jgi:hypothetical protein
LFNKIRCGVLLDSGALNHDLKGGNKSKCPKYLKMTREGFDTALHHPYFLPIFKDVLVKKIGGKNHAEIKYILKKWWLKS